MIDRDASVATERIGRDVVIESGARVGPSVTLDDEVVIGANAVVTGSVHLRRGAVVEPGAVVGKPPLDMPWLKHRPSFERRVEVGEGSAIGANAVVYEGVSVGDTSLIGDCTSVRENVTIGASCAIGRHVTIQPDVRVGDRSRVYDHTHLTVACRVDEDVFIGVGVTTTADDAFAREAFDPTRVLGPHICSRASIGAGAVLLRTVVIGEDAVVGAGSVVTRSVSPGARVLGAPAREQAETTR